MICLRVPASTVPQTSHTPWPCMRLAPPPLEPARRPPLPLSLQLRATRPEAPSRLLPPPEEQDAERWDGMA